MSAAGPGLASTSAASSSTMRDEGAGAGAGTTGAGQGTAHSGLATTTTAAQRMPSTIHTIPVWARHHDASPWQSPDLGPQRDHAAAAITWPRDGGGGRADCSAAGARRGQTMLRQPSAMDLEDHLGHLETPAQPEPRGGPAGTADGRRGGQAVADDTSDSSASSHHGPSAGPGRFWAFTMPRMQRPQSARPGRAPRRESVMRDRGASALSRDRTAGGADSKVGDCDGKGRDRYNELEEAEVGSSSTEDSHRVRQRKEDRGRRSSFGQSYHGALSEAIASLAAGSYMGSAKSRQKSEEARERESGSRPGKEHHDDNNAHRRLDPGEGEDEEKQMFSPQDGSHGGWSHDEPSRDVEQQRRQPGAAYDTSFSRHQPLTPGWESPWRPESRGEHSIRIGRYRFNNHGEGSYFPRTDTGHSRGSGRLRKTRKRAGDGLKAGPWFIISPEWWRTFLLHNAVAPLIFRIVNVAFTTATLAVAIKLYRILLDQDAEDSVGSSPIVAIIFSPLTLLHVGIQMYLEYFSKPIGLWRVGSKLFYTLIELIFVCLWSAELSLSFDNYFTSTLVCTTSDSPYTANGPEATSSNVEPDAQMLDMPNMKPEICSLQIALIGLSFTSLIAYVVVLSLSLFRIFVRVSKH